MPRQARLDAPGALHHVMIRGVNKSNIFNDAQDKSAFLSRLGVNVEKAKASVLAWVLMDNHVHILLKSGAGGISEIMRRLLSGYAQYFNRRHKRTGHLFENRYKSILCDEDKYLLALVRYIHLNPVRVGMIKNIAELDKYIWSGHSMLVKSSTLAWMDVKNVLAQFGSKPRRAIEAYRSYIVEGLSHVGNDQFRGGGLKRSVGDWSQVVAMRSHKEKQSYDERILGDSDFVERILKETEEKQLRQLRYKQEGKTIQKIIEEECKIHKINVIELKNGSRRKLISETRRIIASRAREEQGLSSAEIARNLGVATSSIARALERVV
jgi:REP element-mobilizing transposase RayT